MAVNNKKGIQPEIRSVQPILNAAFLDSRKPGTPKGELLMSLIEQRNYWESRPEPDCMEYAQAFERLIAAFTMPKEN